MQRILITGANRGLGLEFVRQLLARGDRVIAGCRHPGRATALNELAAAHPGRLNVLPVDVAKPASIAELAREAAQLVDALDVLINNAGMLPSGERFGHLEADTLSAAFEVNVTGPLLLSQTLAPLLQKAQGAKIANISSVIGSIAETTAFRTPSYAIAKAAQNMASRLLAAALHESGITVLALHPGWVRTDMGGANAPLAPDDAVAALLRTIDAATIAQSGGFYDGDGRALKW